MSQHFDILIESDIMGSASKFLAICYELFQGSHVQDLQATFWSPRSRS